MFILTNNELKKEEIGMLQKLLISKKPIDIKNGMVINNPKHLELMKNFDISKYNYLYEVNDYIITLNENLFNYIKDKDFDYILKTLYNTHEDNVYSKEIINYIIANNKINFDFLNKSENLLKSLINDIYFSSKENPSIKIAEIRSQLSARNDLSEIEMFKLHILKGRATRWTLLKAISNLHELQDTLINGFDFETIEDALNNENNYIYLSEKEYSSIFSKTPGQKIILASDLFTGFRYKDLKALKNSLNVNYKKLKHIYIASNNYILKKLTYSDFLKSEEATLALVNMFRCFNINNIDTSSFNVEFLEEVITNNHDEIKDLIVNKFMSLVDENLKDLFINEPETSTNDSSNDVLSFISNLYDI